MSRRDGWDGSRDRTGMEADGDPVDDEALSAWLDSELEGAEEACVRAAVARTPALRERVARLRAVDARLRALPTPEVPPDLHARLRSRLAGEAPTASAPAPARAGTPVGRAAPRRAGWRRVVAPALAAAAAAVAGVLLVSRLVGPESVEAPPEPVARVAPAPEASGRVEGPVALAGVRDEDAPVVEVLDFLEELDELERSGRG